MTEQIDAITPKEEKEERKNASSPNPIWIMPENKARLTGVLLETNSAIIEAGRP
ncbi:hypothetical protein [Cytobacillus sp. FSL H8-0458]|uniref:hypothetical protein n=1 Tax=Cytobacillus sp. FSL H8-0458 TaxID=2975346 RepID=UPI0030F60189